MNPRNAAISVRLCSEQDLSTGFRIIELAVEIYMEHPVELKLY
jgi:hypothetical protein